MRLLLQKGPGFATSYGAAHLNARAYPAEKDRTARTVR